MPRRCTHSTSCQTDRTQKSPCRPIKVALIDDGVKTSYEYLNDQVHCGKSEWGLTSPKPRGGDSEKKRRFRNYASTYTSSYTGHGTVMAYYICRMCPAVELCIAKLEPQSPSKNNVAAGTHSQQIAFTIESVTEVSDSTKFYYTGCDCGSFP